MDKPRSVELLFDEEDDFLRCCGMLATDVPVEVGVDQVGVDQLLLEALRASASR
jgi:hypothetical protein